MKTKQIEGFPDYRIADTGLVINTKTGRVFHGSKKKTGYIEVMLRDENGRKKYHLLHRLVAAAFCVKPTGQATEVNHKDGDKENNNASNLEWVTHAANLRHAFEAGLRRQDVAPRSVRAVNLKTGERFVFSSIYKAARALGISQGNICMACKGQRPHAGGYKWAYEEVTNE